MQLQVTPPNAPITIRQASPLTFCMFLCSLLACGMMYSVNIVRIVVGRRRRRCSHLWIDMKTNTPARCTGTSRPPPHPSHIWTASTLEVHRNGHSISSGRRGNSTLGTSPSRCTVVPLTGPRNNCPFDWKSINFPSHGAELVWVVFVFTSSCVV